MSAKTVSERVTDILVKRLVLTSDSIQSGSLIVDDLGADSLDTVELIMDTEDEFGFRIRDPEVEHIRTVQDAVDYIEKRLKEQKHE